MDVYKFPPVRISAYENSTNDPMDVSVGTGGGARGSQTQASRAVYLASVHGPGDGVGYVETLKTLLVGKLPLVQVDTLPSVWWGRVGGNREVLRSNRIEWTSGGNDLEWVDYGDDLHWYEKGRILSTSGNDGFDYIDITGISLGTRIHVGEAVQGGGALAYVLRSVTSDGESTRVHLTGPIPDGDVTIGQTVTRVFRMKERPRVMQSSGSFTYSFDMIEAFESDFVDGFNVLDPWSAS